MAVPQSRARGPVFVATINPLIIPLVADYSAPPAAGPGRAPRDPPATRQGPRPDWGAAHVRRPGQQRHRRRRGARPSQPGGRRLLRYAGRASERRAPARRVDPDGGWRADRPGRARSRRRPARDRYSRLLGCPVATLYKTRLSGHEVRVQQIVGEVRDRVPFIVDDMISTGGTVAAAVRALVAFDLSPSRHSGSATPTRQPRTRHPS